MIMFMLSDFRQYDWLSDYFRLQIDPSRPPLPQQIGQTQVSLCVCHSYPFTISFKRAVVSWGQRVFLVATAYVEASFLMKYEENSCCSETLNLQWVMLCEAATWSSVVSTPAVPCGYALHHFDAFVWFLITSKYMGRCFLKNNGVCCLWLRLII